MNPMDRLALAMAVIFAVIYTALWWYARADRRPAVLQDPPEKAPESLPQPLDPRLTDEVGRHSIDGPTEPLGGLRVPCACRYDTLNRRVDWHPACPYHGWRVTR